MDPALGGGDGELERVGHLLVGEADEVAQDDYLAVLLGQRRQGLLDVRPGLGDLGARLRLRLAPRVRGALRLRLRQLRRSDHQVLMLESGLVLALHFDNPDLAKAKNLNWIATGIPGVFTKADQARVNKRSGPGATHFHDLESDVHGGKPGTQGVWFLHVGARNFTAPFGKVTKGQMDPNFMPTAPPS